MTQATENESLPDLSRGWETLPLFHVFCLQGVPLRGWIHDIAVWKPCVDELSFVVEALGEPTGVRTSQSDGIGKAWLRFPKMTWRPDDHHRWTTRYAALKHLPNYRFVDMEAECPVWSEQDRRKVNPQFSLKVTARLPTEYWGKQRGARHELVLALRDEWLTRIGEPRVLAALHSISPQICTFAAHRARRSDLVNLLLPGHPQQDGGLRADNTPWTPIDGVPLMPCRDDVETAPDSAGPSARLTHADGRTIDVGIMRGALQLSIRDSDGEVVTRKRSSPDPEKGLQEVVAEMISDGFRPDGPSPR